MALSLLYSPNLTSIRDYWKNHSFDYTDLVGKLMFLLFNMLSSFVIAILPRSKCLLISCLQSPSAVVLEPKKKKSVTVSIVSPSICHEVMGAMVQKCAQARFSLCFHSAFSWIFVLVLNT